MKTTKTTTTSLVSLVTLTAAALFANSAISADERIVSDGLEPGDSNSRWVAGVLGGSIDNPYLGEEDGEAYLDLNLEYRGENMFSSKQDIFGYTLMRHGGFSGGLVVNSKETAISRGEWIDSRELDGIDERDFTIDAGVYMVHNSLLGQLRVRALQEVTGEHDGQTVEAKYTFNFGLGPVYVNPMVGVTWASDATVDYFYGVSDSEANANRAAYEGKSTVNLHTGLRTRYDIDEHWDMEARAIYTAFGSGITDSSIVEDDGMLTTSVGVNYNF